MAREIFEIRVHLDSEERVLRIQSRDSDQNGDIFYSVSAGTETLGLLQQTADGWKWAEGLRSAEDAQAIGAYIESHSS